MRKSRRATLCQSKRPDVATTVSIPGRAAMVIPTASAMGQPASAQWLWPGRGTGLCPEATAPQGGCIYPPGAVPPCQANKDGPFLIFEPYQSRTRAVPSRTRRAASIYPATGTASNSALGVGMVRIKRNHTLLQTGKLHPNRLKAELRTRTICGCATRERRSKRTSCFRHVMC